MMIDVYTAMVLAAPRNDDSENIVRILVFVIIMAMVMIGNIGKAKTEAAEKKKQQEARRAAAKKRKELAADLYAAKPAREQGDGLLDWPERPAYTYPRGGFGEVLADAPPKSSLEKFIELKDVDIERTRHQLGSDIRASEARPEDTPLFSELEGIAGDVDLGEAEQTDRESTVDSIFDQSLGTVAQAIIHREIFDKPLALRNLF